MGNEESKPPTLYRRISKALPPVAPQYGCNENSDWVDKGAKAFASEGDRDQFIYGLLSLLTSNGTLNLSNHDIKLFFTRRPANPPINTNTNTNTNPSSTHQTTTQTPSPSSKPSWRTLLPSSPSSYDDDGTRVLATLVAIDEAGVIRVKIASETDGRDVAEAFRAFKRDVEGKLEGLLRGVPSGAVGIAGVVEGQGQGKDGNGSNGPNGEREVQMQRVAVASRMEREVVDAPPAYGDVKSGKRG